MKRDLVFAKISTHYFNHVSGFIPTYFYLFLFLRFITFLAVFSTCRLLVPKFLSASVFNISLV